MSILILIIAFILLTIGFIGSIIPGLPGPTFSYLGILIIHFFTEYQFSTSVLFIIGIIAFLIFVLDYSLQAMGVKKYGGGKKATIGTFVGLFIGFLSPPFGILLCPFIGAFIGAYMEVKNDKTRALKIAFGSFLGFISGTIIKLCLSTGLLFFSADHIIRLFFK